MAKKPYSPMATYDELKRVEGEINKAETIDKIREIVYKDGPKVGYKAFCYMLGGRMNPEGMKPDEACVAAATLEQQGKEDEAMMFLGVLLLFLGFAFLISAAATYWLSKKWGLIDGSAAGKGQGKIRG